jgi:putative membrane protein insertion efficiency factor
VIGHRNPVSALLVWLVRGYQVFISPGLPGRCRYYPSCSQYAIDALREYGVLRGLVLASWRVLRCNPFSYGGYDPVERQSLFAPRSGEDSSGPRKVSRPSRPRRQRAGTV